MKRNEQNVIQTIDKYRGMAAERENMFFAPRPLALPREIPLFCEHCGKNQKIRLITLYPNAGMMANNDLNHSEVSIIANCPVCGNRMALSAASVKKGMKARVSMIRTLVVLIVILAVLLVMGGMALRSSQSERNYEQGSAAWEQGDYGTAVSFLQQAYKYGNTDAAYLLSLCYRSGEGVPQDVQQADQLLEEALEKKSGLALYNVGMSCFEDYIANGSQQSLTECITYLQDSDDARAKYQLSLMTRTGIGMVPNTDEADTLLRTAAQQGSSAALNDLAVQMAGSGQAQEALEMLQKYGDPEDPDITAARGYVSLFADNVEEGTSLLNQALQRGSSWAAYYWGLIYYNSLLTGTERDLNSAANYFQQAVNGGNYRGKCELALCLAVMGDSDRAQPMAQDCYNRGYLEAACVLGDFASDETQKLNYMKQAASVNYSPAEIWMAWYYSQIDLEQCGEYLERAYMHGARYEANIAAQNYFGVGADYYGPGYVS